MNYNQAKRIMDEHAANVQRSGGAAAATALPYKKRLKNATWLERETWDEPLQWERDRSDKVVEIYTLSLFRKTIITFSPEHMELEDHGYFSRTTHDRFNEYLPQGFRVWGSTPSQMASVNRPLGYIKTPRGVFPYAMPMTFTYDGELLVSSAVAGPLTRQARKVVEALPQYIKNYLNTSENRIMNASMPDPDGIGRCILENEFRDAFLLEALLPTHEGLRVQDAIVFLQHGAGIFKKPRTREEIARHAEATILYAHKIPILPKRTLHRIFREALENTLLYRLGFAVVEWNRRERL